MLSHIHTKAELNCTFTSAPVYEAGLGGYVPLSRTVSIVPCNVSVESRPVLLEA